MGGGTPTKHTPALFWSVETAVYLGVAIWHLYAKALVIGDADESRLGTFALENSPAEDGEIDLSIPRANAVVQLVVSDHSSFTPPAEFSNQLNCIGYESRWFLHWFQIEGLCRILALVCGGSNNT